MSEEVRRLCNIVQAYPRINQALELYFLLNSDVKLWGCGKPIGLPVEVTTTDFLKDAGEIQTFSLRISRRENDVISFSEPGGGSPNAALFSASYIDLQHMFHKPQGDSNSNPWEVARVMDLGGNLEVWINGAALCREIMFEVIESRLSEALSHFQGYENRRRYYTPRDRNTQSCRMSPGKTTPPDCNPPKYLARPSRSSKSCPTSPASVSPDLTLRSSTTPPNKKLSTSLSSSREQGLGLRPMNFNIPTFHLPPMIGSVKSLHEAAESAAENLQELGGRQISQPASRRKRFSCFRARSFRAPSNDDRGSTLGSNFPPPACTLGRDKIEVLWTTMKKRRQESSCSRMIRCLCTYHGNDIFGIQEFYDSIVEAVGDVAMTRGTCPMCCISTSQRSKKPLVRFSEEICEAKQPDHDWSDYQFRGMLFEMFPRNWVAVENKVYKNKILAVSSAAKWGFVMLRKSVMSARFSAEEVFTSHIIRPWPLYEMAISKSHGTQACCVALQYLDAAFGDIFRKQFLARFSDENQAVTRVLVSAAQMIPGGNCLMDDTVGIPVPHSRSNSHIVACLVAYRSPGTRVLSEMLRTWDTFDWNEDIPSYLNSIFREQFHKGAFGYYYNSERSKAVKVETFQGSLHVTFLRQRIQVKAMNSEVPLRRS